MQNSIFTGRSGSLSDSANLPSALGMSSETADCGDYADLNAPFRTDPFGNYFAVVQPDHVVIIYAESCMFRVA